MQVSGLKVVYDNSRPEGQRVKEVTVAGPPLLQDKTYRIATNDFLLAGGDQYTTFKEGQRLAYGDTLRDAFINYLSRHSPVSPKVEGRITGISP
jgi:2',3'-cyclic-nucleotide 2'-phosphodiesterase (5'-nucleotidase family)